jgi:DNA-binding transcriptional LysR family regulator
MPKSTVSRKVSELEARLGARLLQRTTRQLALTDVGNTFFRHAARVVAEMEEGERAVTELQATPRGLLRVTTPLNFGYLGPIVASFLEREPAVRLEMVCTDRVVHLVEEGFDVAIRAGRLQDSSLIARSLGVMQSYLVATPSFLKKHGTPKAPDDLRSIDCIVFGAGTDRATWKLQSKSKATSVTVRPRIVVNDFDILHDAARGGLGIASIPVFRVLDELRDKRLRRVLPDWCSPDMPVHAVYPSTRHLSPALKAFLDHVQASSVPAAWAGERRQ